MTWDNFTFYFPNYSAFLEAFIVAQLVTLLL
jgi:hypothetical protein